MNSAVQHPSDLPILPADPASRSAVPVVLTAQSFLHGRSDFTAGLYQENFDLRYVAVWNRLLEAIDRVQADVVLVDIDDADLVYDGLQTLSGYRLVTLLLQQLANRPVAVVVVTTLDFAEIDDLARAGVHAIVSPDISSDAFVEQVRIALHRARGRHALQSSGRCDVASTRAGQAPLGHPPKSLEVDDGWRLPDQLWHKIEELLPVVRHPARTRLVDRRAADAILFVLRSGIPWTRLPKSLGSAATARERVLKWGACGIIEDILAVGLDARVDWEHLHWDRLASVFGPRFLRLSNTSPIGSRTRLARVGEKATGPAVASQVVA